METSKNYGMIFDIQRMSLHDGPGIRTTIFFKGCSMHCFWCHNPESLTPGVNIQFFSDRCIGCHLCETVCEEQCHRFDSRGIHVFDRSSCIKCGKCADICPSGSLVKTGEKVALEELADLVCRDKAFFDNSGGGVTASGGEPLLQSEFIAGLFRILKARGINTAIETALNVPSEALKNVLACTDFFFADMKHPDSSIHKSLTGVGNEQIIRNFSLLDESGLPYAIRIPVIPGVNDTEGIMRAFQNNIRKLQNPLYLELMPYHEFGIGKYDSLAADRSKLDTIHPPSREKLMQLAACFDSLKVVFRDGSKEITYMGGVLCKQNELA